MIAHAHVSLGRKYMLYRPGGGEKKEQALIEALHIQPVEGQAAIHAQARVLEGRSYLSVFGRIKCLDEVCFERLCQSIAVPMPALGYEEWYGIIIVSCDKFGLSISKRPQANRTCLTRLRW